MKTPREILLARHAGAARKLDAIRAGVVAEITASRKESGVTDVGQQAGFVEFLLSLRWHAAALSAVWLIIALLGREGAASAQGSVANTAEAPPPFVCIVALRECRRQLAALMEPQPKPEPAPLVPHAFIPRRRQEAECSGIA